MPNRRVHISVSAPSGLAYAAYRAQNLPTPCLLVESFGGLVGGTLGGLVPDLIDRPTSPNHRSVAHGVLPAAALGSVAFVRLDEWQNALRIRAQHYEQLQSAASSPLAQFGYGVLEFLFRFLAGALAGFPAGYASHLVLDFTTSRSLPVAC